jgi:hypothetical protein
MKVELVINHDETGEPALLGRLTHVFGPTKREALDQSVSLSLQADYWADVVLFAVDGSRYRLFCTRMTNTELQALIELKDEDARAAADSAWTGLRQAFKGLSPSLEKAEITFDGRPLFTASTGAWSTLAGRDSRLALFIGLVNVLWILAASSTFADDKLVDLITGAAPALATAVVFGAIAIHSGWKKRLQWTS